MTFLKETSNIFKIAIAAITTIAALGGSIVAVDNYFMSEAEAAQSLGQIQKSFELQIQQQQKQMKMMQYDFLTEQYYKQKRYVQEHPQDLEAQEELNYIIQKRNNLRRDLGL